MWLKVFIMCIAVIALTRTDTAEVLTQDVINAFLQAHNDARALVSVPPLVWDQTLSDYAAKWSSGCVWTHTNGAYGGNIHCSYPLKDNALAAQDAVTLWKSEITNVDLPNWNCMFSLNNTCGHYSQVVWRDTQRVGCGITHCNSVKKLTNYVVCEYDRGGNVMGKTPY
ncbi:hypothetical protein Btru_027858 [Bulinus truncatus]|nr:hypothetical protein Btru_027858 [Bulinus truncatus]